MVKSNKSFCSHCGQSDSLFDKKIWMTIKDAARYLGRTTNAVYIAVYRGHLSKYKWNGKLYFRRSDLDRLLESSLA